MVDHFNEIKIDLLTKGKKLYRIGGTKYLSKSGEPPPTRGELKKR